MFMKVTNISDFKAHLSAYLAAVERGEEVEIRKRDLPIARIVPISTTARNATRLGCGRGSVVENGDLTEPLIPARDWDMFGYSDDESRS